VRRLSKSVGYTVSSNVGSVSVISLSMCLRFDTCEVFMCFILLI